MHSAVKAYHKACKMDLRDRLILEHLYYVRHILGKMLGGLPDRAIARSSGLKC